MKKITYIIALFSLCFGFSFSFSLAAETNLNPTLNKIKQKREYIYSNLDLNDAQKAKQTELDSKYFEAIKPNFDAIERNIKEINDLANSKNISKEEVDSIKKEFDKNEKELFETKVRYEKEFKKILTFKQKIKYSGLKRKTRAELKKEVDEEIKKLKNNQ